MTETLVYKEPKSLLKDCRFTFCPGCGHGVVLRLIAELIDEFSLQDKTIAVASVGCSVFLEKFFNCDVVGASHGRAPCVASGVKRAKPDKFVFTYQGDGDALTIGFNETVHTSLRGENILEICINNTNFGMTGGQASATTLVNQVTTTTPKGKDPQMFGFPIHSAEMLQHSDGAAFVARGAICNVKHVRNLKKILKRAFEIQLNNLGFSFVEVVSSCPTNWKMTPIEANRYIEEEILKVHNVGVFKDTSGLGELKI